MSVRIIADLAPAICGRVTLQSYIRRKEHITRPAASNYRYVGHGGFMRSIDRPHMMMRSVLNRGARGPKYSVTVYPEVFVQRFKRTLQSIDILCKNYSNVIVVIVLLRKFVFC